MATDQQALELANAYADKIIGQQNWQTQFDDSTAYRDRVFDYGSQRDTVGDQQWQQSFDYGKERYHCRPTTATIV